MNSELKKNIDKEKEACSSKIEELQKWLKKHHPSHKNYEQMRRNLSIALYKLKVIEARYNPTQRRAIQTYSIPKFNK